MNNNNKEIEYVVMDPSKNITILVTSVVDENDYELVAKNLLEKEPIAEQVGFLKYKEKNNSDKTKSEEECDIILNMAGGEFCGNATMSAAVYYAMNNSVEDGDVTVKISSINKNIKVHIKMDNTNIVHNVRRNVVGDFHHEFIGTVEMPRAKEVREVVFPNAETFPVVFFDGIAHIIFDINKINLRNKIFETKTNDIQLNTDSKKNFECDKEYIKENTDVNKNTKDYKLSEEFKKFLEDNIKAWCEFLKIPALGVMVLRGLAELEHMERAPKVRPYNVSFRPYDVSFRPYDVSSRPYDVSSRPYDDSVSAQNDVNEVSMIPLVYVKSVDTLYWESSCASGSTAVGEYLKSELQKEINVDVMQTSGEFLNIVNKSNGSILLRGKVKYLYSKKVIV